MVDICTTLGHYIIEIIKIILILSTFLLATAIIVATQYKQYIEDNWIEYRCNPLVFPFAGYFGHDSGETFSNCMMQIFTGFGGDMLAPISFMAGSMSSILKDFTDQIQGMREFFYTFRSLFLNFVVGIMKRIEDGASTLQFLMAKLKAILERLWGIMVTVIYTGFTSIETMTSVFKGPIGGFAKLFCFDGDNEVLMINKEKKKISEINVNDKIYLGGKVIAKMKFTSEDNIMCEYNGVIVSVSHLVKYKNEWKRLYNVDNKKIIKDYDKKYIYCLVTENNLITINNCIFTDYIETSNPYINRKIKNIMLTHLNNKDYKRMSIQYKKDFYCTGFDKDTLIKMKVGYKKIKDIKIGDLIHNGNKVIGKIKQNPINQKVCILDNIILSDSNIILYKNNWMEVKDIDNIKYKEYNENLYNICVEGNILYIGEHIFRDYEEVDDNQTCLKCDNYIEKHLNKNKCNLKKKSRINS